MYKYYLQNRPAPEQLQVKIPCGGIHRHGFTGTGTDASIVLEIIFRKTPSFSHRWNDEILEVQWRITFCQVGSSRKFVRKEAMWWEERCRLSLFIRRTNKSSFVLLVRIIIESYSSHFSQDSAFLFWLLVAATPTLPTGIVLYEAQARTLGPILIVEGGL